MIWNDTKQGNELRVATRVVNAIEKFSGDGGQSIPDLPELAIGVEFFLNEKGCPVLADDDDLLLLASKAMTSLGCEDRAVRVLLMGSGTLRSEDWPTCGTEGVWVLDMGKIGEKGTRFVELSFHNLLERILSSAADVWDGTNGRGALAVVNTGTMPCRDVLSLCGKRLERIAKSRGWSSTPRVVKLDP